MVALPLALTVFIELTALRACSRAYVTAAGSAA